MCGPYQPEGKQLPYPKNGLTESINSHFHFIVKSKLKGDNFYIKAVLFFKKSMYHLKIKPVNSIVAYL